MKEFGLFSLLVDYQHHKGLFQHVERKIPSSPNLLLLQSVFPSSLESLSDSAYSDPPPLLSQC